MERTLPVKFAGRKQIDADLLLRNPSRMRREKSVYDANLVSHEETEAQAKQTGSECESTGKRLTSISNHSERGGKAHCDQHHARNGAYAEDQQVGNGPVNISDRGQDQQGDSRRTGKSMHYADNERPKILIQADLSE